MRSSHALALARSLCLVSAAVAEITLLTEVVVVNVETDALLGPTSVLIREGIIAEIGNSIAMEEAIIFDGGSGFLIPGLGLAEDLRRLR